MQGWIKLHRRMLDWEWYDDTNTFRVFIHLLLSANHKPKKHRGVSIPAGAIMTGREKLAAQTGIPVQVLRTSLNRLKSTNEITIKSNSKGTIIEVVKWDEYQQANQLTNQQLTSDQPATNQQLTTNKNGKNGKNEKNIINTPLNPPKGKRFVKPSLEQVSEYCRKRNNSVNPEAFIDFYESNGWKVGKNSMKDWKAAVRTWEKRPSQPKQQSFPPGQILQTDIDMAAVAEAQKRIAQEEGF